MGVVTNTEVVDFTGGMNTVKAKHLIHPSESIGLVNVDIRDGSLRSMPDLSRVSIAAGSYFVEFRDRPYFYDSFRSNAFMADNMYWADGKDTGKVLKDGRVLDLGIATPSAPLNISNAGTGGTHTGDFKYTYTFYSTTTGVESAPAPLPPYLTVDQADIIVDNFDVFPILFPTKGSFATVGLKGHGKIKFHSQSPGKIELDNPFGTKGFFSYNMWYAGLIIREERLLKVLVCASV